MPPETLRLLGLLAGHPVVVLVDSGNTHNFIQQDLVNQLRLPCRTTSIPLRVMVGNGQNLQCTSLCEAVSLDLQYTQFTINLHVLPIVGANVALGVQWLKSLGLIIIDYNTLCIQFFYDGCLVQLQGDKDFTLTPVTSSQFRRLSRMKTVGLYCHISLLAEDFTVFQDLLPAIQSLLTKFAVLFQQPNTLPPERDTDHHIHLLPQSAQVNVHPNRYPHF